MHILEHYQKAYSCQSICIDIGRLFNSSVLVNCVSTDVMQMMRSDENMKTKAFVSLKMQSNTRSKLFVFVLR